MKHIVALFICFAAVAAPVSAQAPRSAASTRDSAPNPDRTAFLILIHETRRTVVEAAEAMPADKYGFVPTAGDFANVRSFSRQVKHLSATNYMLAAAAIGQAPPDDAGDEQGPDSVVTKAQHLAYLRGSFDALERAAQALGDARTPVLSSPISPLQGTTATRAGLISEALTHGYDHYGQMVEYLRMNGITPPASKR